ALVMVPALNVPLAGAWLGFALLAAAAWMYQVQVARRSEDVRPPLTGQGPLPEPDLGGAAENGRPYQPAPRGVLSVGAAAGPGSPWLARNGGHLLYRNQVGAGSFPLEVAAAVAGWVVLPLLLLAANARDGFRPMPLPQVARAVARHPLATLAALAIFPA